MADEPQTGDADDVDQLPRDLRVETLERDVQALTTNQSKLVRSNAALVRCVEAMMNKDPGPAGVAIGEAKRAMSTNPLDHVGDKRPAGQASDDEDGPGF